MSNDGSNREQVLRFLEEILNPDYEKKFRNHNEIAKYLEGNGLYISQSTVSRYLKDTDFIKIGDYYTISPKFYKRKYQGILREILSLTKYQVVIDEEFPGLYHITTDHKNDVIIIELLKIIFPFETINLITQGYRYICIDFDLKSLSKEDKGFLDSIFK